MSEWIDVKDRIPGKRGEYLAFTPEQTIMGITSVARRNVLDWTGTRWRSSFTVSHWAELPAPPQSSRDAVQKIDK